MAKKNETMETPASSPTASAAISRSDTTARGIIVFVAIMVPSAPRGLSIENCLVCPVGLSFATVLVIWRAFAHGDATIGLILIPA